MKNYILSEDQIRLLVEVESSISSMTVVGSKITMKSYAGTGDFIFVNNPKEISDLDNKTLKPFNQDALKSLSDNNGTLYIKVDNIEFAIKNLDNNNFCGEVKLAKSGSLSIPYKCLEKSDRNIIDNYFETNNFGQTGTPFPTTSPSTIDIDVQSIEGISKGSIFEKINSLKNWLVEGYGMKYIIDDMLNPIKQNIPNDQILKFTLGAITLKNSGKISVNRYESFVNLLSKSKLVFNEDGSWNKINKLNTNYSEISNIITDFLFERNKIDSILKINSTKSQDKDRLKIILLGERPSLIDFIYDLTSSKKITSYTNFIEKTSQIGENTENRVKSWLLNLGYKILYQGGDGDLIDMKLSVDLIVETPLGEIKTIQVKTTEDQVNRFMNDVRDGLHGAVDIVIYPYGPGFMIVDVKTGRKNTFKYSQ